MRRAQMTWSPHLERTQKYFTYSSNAAVNLDKSFFLPSHASSHVGILASLSMLVALVGSLAFNGRAISKATSVYSPCCSIIYNAKYLHRYWGRGHVILFSRNLWENGLQMQASTPSRPSRSQPCSAAGSHLAFSAKPLVSRCDRSLGHFVTGVGSGRQCLQEKC